MDAKKLIGFVFARSPLWDKRDKNHHNRFILDKLWDEVAVEMNTTRDLARSKWKALRDKYRTVLNQIPTPRSGAAAQHHQISWPYFQSLHFLKDMFTPRASTTNFDENGEEDLLNLESESLENSRDVIVVPEEIESENTTTGGNNTRKRKMNEEIGNVLISIGKEKLEFFKQQKELERQNTEREYDDDINFFKSLLPGIKTLSFQKKINFRIGVMKLLKEEMQDSQEDCY